MASGCLIQHHRVSGTCGFFFLHFGMLSWLSTVSHVLCLSWVTLPYLDPSIYKLDDIIKKKTKSAGSYEALMDF